MRSTNRPSSNQSSLFFNHLIDAGKQKPASIKWDPVRIDQGESTKANRPRLVQEGIAKAGGGSRAPQTPPFASAFGDTDRRLRAVVRTYVWLACSAPVPCALGAAPVPSALHPCPVAPKIKKIAKSQTPKITKPQNPKIRKSENPKI